MYLHWQKVSLLLTCTACPVVCKSLSQFSSFKNKKNNPEMDKVRLIRFIAIVRLSLTCLFSFPLTLQCFAIYELLKEGGSLRKLPKRQSWIDL